MRLFRFTRWGSGEILPAKTTEGCPLRKPAATFGCRRQEMGAGMACDPPNSRSRLAHLFQGGIHVLTPADHVVIPKSVLILPKSDYPPDPSSAPALIHYFQRRDAGGVR